MARALANFGRHNAVRTMSIQKSKGLEFDTVVKLGVEDQAFWANEERNDACSSSVSPVRRGGSF